MPAAADRPVVVSVVDDHPDLCYGVLARLSQPGTAFVPGVMAATVSQFLDLDSPDHRSDVVLLDLTLKDQSAPQRNVGTLKDLGYRVVIYTGEERPERLRLRQRARATAMSQADASALEHARQVAGPVLRRVSAGQPISPELRAAAGLASAALRDHLLAPGFLTPGLAGQVRKARAAGAEVTVSCPRSASTALVPPARRLLAAALDRAGPAAELALHIHPITGHRPDLLILRLRSPGAPAYDHAALCSAALECGAQVSSLGPDALLIRLPAGHVQPVRSPPA